MRLIKRSIFLSTVVLFVAACAQQSELAVEDLVFEKSNDPGGCSVEHIAVSPSTNHYQYDSLSSDGGVLAVAWDRGDDGSGTYLFDLSTGERTDLPSLNNGAVFAPDGKTLVNSVYVENGKTDIIEFDIASGETTVISPHPEWDWLASYSSDGETILFNSFRTGRSDIYSFNKVDETLTQWTDYDGYEAHGQFSPDDKEILFHRSDQQGNFDIFLIDVETATIRQLTDALSEESYGSWGPDGDVIVMASDRNQPSGETDLFLMDRDGENIRQITDHPAKDAYPFFSPDGRYLYFNSAREPQGIYRITFDEEFNCLSSVEDG